jgi:glycosyltransferase involved in cell wall biosynthesis
MKILMLNANVSGCGTYHRARWFARICARSGRHQVTLCTVSRNQRWRRTARVEDGVTITEGPNWGYRFIPGYGSNWLDIAWRGREIRSGGYDVIYAFEYHPNVAWPLCTRTKRQVLLSDWCDWYAGAANFFKGLKLAHAWDRRREERIRRKADRVSVISSLLRNRAEKAGVAPADISLIREGVDTEYMKPYDTSEARGILGMPADARIIGTLNDGAAFPYLVSAFSEVYRRMPDTRLLFVGQPSQSQCALVASYGVSDAFTATGRCSDEELPRFLSAADVCALPMDDRIANQARFPHKIGDYLACGRPVVVTDVGDYPAMLRRDDAAVVAGSLDSFTESLHTLLNDSEQRRYYAARGRDWVRRHLDWNVLAPGILRFIEGQTP